MTLSRPDSNQISRRDDNSCAGSTRFSLSGAMWQLSSTATSMTGQASSALLRADFSFLTGRRMRLCWNCFRSSEPPNQLLESSNNNFSTGQLASNHMAGAKTELRQFKNQPAVPGASQPAIEPQAAMPDDSNAHRDNHKQRQRGPLRSGTLRVIVHESSPQYRACKANEPTRKVCRRIILGPSESRRQF